MLTKLNQSAEKSCQNESTHQDYTSPIARDLASQATGAGIILKIVPGTFRQVKGNTTFTSWRNGGGDVLISGAFHSANLADMNFAVVSPAGSGRRPDVENSLAGSNIQIPFSTEINNIGPAKLSPQDWIGNDNSAVANFQLGSHERQVQECYGATDPENCGNDVFGAAHNDARPQSYATQQGSATSKDKTAARSKALAVVHSPIFSQRIILVDRKAR